MKSQLEAKFKSIIDFEQSAFCDGGGDAAPAGGDSAQGFGNANSRGTTFISGENKPKVVNVDEVLHDQSNYSEDKFPIIVYAEDSCEIHLPVTQEIYSIGNLTPTTVAKLNSKFEAKWNEFSAESDGNSGNPTTVEREVQINTLVPNHQSYEGMIKTGEKGDQYIRTADNQRSDDARDPEKVPVANILVRDLSDIIHRGVRSDQKVDDSEKRSALPSPPEVSGTELPNLSNIPVLVPEVDPRAELVQKLLNLESINSLTEEVYSIAGRVATGVAANVATNVALKAVGTDNKTAQSSANKAGVAAAMNANSIKKGVTTGVNTIVNKLK